MSMDIGFISANYVARVSDYDGVDEWSEHDVRTRHAFDLDDIETWIDDVAAMGFDGLSLWTAHCWYHEVDDGQVAEVREIAERAGLSIYSYAGGFGLPPEHGSWDRSDRANWERTYEVADELGCGWLSGGYGAEENRVIVREMADTFGIDFAYENHGEASVAEIRERIEGYEDCMGVAFDTGWAGTQGFDAADAIRDLDDLLFEVHLKDVTAAGEHRTCVLGDGVVGIEACLDALVEIGYDGWVSIEHEPFDHDPTDEVRTSLANVGAWLDER